MKVDDDWKYPGIISLKSIIMLLTIFLVLVSVAGAPPSDKSDKNPVITLLGFDPVTVEAGSSYIDAGAIASYADNDITSSLVTVNPVNTAVVGVYTVTYYITDPDKNTVDQKTRTVNVVDTTPPTIDAVTPIVAEATSPSGATVTIVPPMSHDIVDGDLSSICDKYTGTFPLGVTQVTCTKTDANSNAATPSEFTVTVQDTTKPVITLKGNNPEIVPVDSTYTDAGVTVTDNYDTGFTAIMTGTVNTAVKGTYIITYKVKDSSDNAATEITRTVNVVDTTAPAVSTTPPTDNQDSSVTPVETSVNVTYSLPANTPLSSDDNSKGGGGSSRENRNNIELIERSDQPMFRNVVTSFRFTHAKSPVMSVNITGNTSMDMITALEEVLKGTSSLVKAPPNGLVYKNINIWVGTPGYATSRNIKEALIKFKVDNNWIRTNNVTSSDIVLMKWNGDSWIELETRVLSKDNANTFFEGKTITFSPFAIAAKISVAKPADNRSLLETPQQPQVKAPDHDDKPSQPAQTAVITRIGSSGIATWSIILIILIINIVIVALYFLWVRK
ncbi:MAG: PGF-pre-PGF domain-containing protein [Candidatus Methanoperedens sp.]|nr:PGF-pre-PGF domain-containing protein [Candidatus Methanoperedens sp.]